MNYLKEFKGKLFYIAAEVGAVQRFTTKGGYSYDLVVGSEYRSGRDESCMFLGIDAVMGKPCFAHVEAGPDGRARDWRFSWHGDRRTLDRMTGQARHAAGRKAVM